MEKSQSHPFANHKEEFASIPFDKRTNKIQQVLSFKHLPGQPKKTFMKKYKSNGKFLYQGCYLHYSYQLTTDQPLALLFNFHGLNSHGGNSGYFGVQIANKVQNINVFALDLKNFGQSGGQCRGLIDSFQESVGSAESFIDLIVSQYKKKPKIFLSGLSYGGTMAFKMAIDKPDKYAGIVFLSPAIREIKESQVWGKMFIKFVGLYMPRLKVIPQQFTAGTKYCIPHVITGDKHFYTGKLVPGSIRVALNAMEEVQTQYHRMKVPYLLFQSGKDKIIDIFAPLDLEKECPVKDKTTIYCKDMCHYVFIEEEIQHITLMAIDWIKARI